MYGLLKHRSVKYLLKFSVTFLRQRGNESSGTEIGSLFLLKPHSSVVWLKVCEVQEMFVKYVMRFAWLLNISILKQQQTLRLLSLQQNLGLQPRWPE